MATYYTSTTATGAGDGSAGNRWTLEQAFASLLQPDDVVKIGAGTYTGTCVCTSSTQPAWYPAGDGTAGHPITYEAEDPNDKPMITAALRAAFAAENPADTASNPAWGAFNNSYITFRNLATPDLSKRNIGLLNSDHIVLDGVRCLLGDRHGDGSLENWAAVYFSNADDCELKNSEIGRCTSSGNYGVNDDGIVQFDSGGLRVHHNIIREACNGVFDKDEARENQYEYNCMTHFGATAFRLATNSGFSCGITIRRNLINDSLYFVINNLDELDSRDIIADGNTVANTTTGGFRLIAGTTAMQVINNIFDIGASGLFWEAIGSTNLPQGDTFFTCNYYCKRSGSLTAFDASTATATETFATWQARASTVDPQSYDRYSQATSNHPAFQTTTPTTIAEAVEFQLALGSPCRDAGRENGTGAVIHQGAYYTSGVTIGPEEEESEEPSSGVTDTSANRLFWRVA